MKKYYKKNQIFIGFDDTELPQYISLKQLDSSILDKKIRLNKHTSSISLRTLFEQVQSIDLTNDANPQPQREIAIKKAPTKKDKDIAANWLAQLEQNLGKNNE